LHSCTFCKARQRLAHEALHQHSDNAGRSTHSYGRHRLYGAAHLGLIALHAGKLHPLDEADKSWHHLTAPAREVKPHAPHSSCKATAIQPRRLTPSHQNQFVSEIQQDRTSQYDGTCGLNFQSSRNKAGLRRMTGLFVRGRGQLRGIIQGQGVGEG
jgi:hypothetical protein